MFIFFSLSGAMKSSRPGSKKSLRKWGPRLFLAKSFGRKDSPNVVNVLGIRLPSRENYVETNRAPYFFYLLTNVHSLLATYYHQKNGNVEKSRQEFCRNCFVPFR